MIVGTPDTPQAKTPFSVPLINIQNPGSPEETFYGKFRSIVKQRYFGIKLEEESFMEFIDTNQEMKDKLGDFIIFMGALKTDFIGYLKKNHPERIEKRKKKKKGKKKDTLSTLEVPNFEAYSSDYSGALSTSRDETETQSEMQILRSKIDNIKKDFCFDSVENVAKNVHLFDDVFGKLKAEQTKSHQLHQLSQLGLMNFGGGGGFSFPAGNNQKDNDTQLPQCFDYFQELYTRWDQACAETGYDKDYENGET